MSSSHLLPLERLFSFVLILALISPEATIFALAADDGPEGSAAVSADAAPKLTQGVDPPALTPQQLQDMLEEEERKPVVETDLADLTQFYGKNRQKFVPSHVITFDVPAAKKTCIHEDIGKGAGGGGGGISRWEGDMT